MGIYIKGMEMPEHCGYCRFRYDGICHVLQKTQYSKEDCPLVPVQPHGRLIDADAFLALINDSTILSDFLKCIINPLIRGEPTIIPAEEGE